MLFFFLSPIHVLGVLEPVNFQQPYPFAHHYGPDQDLHLTLFSELDPKPEVGAWNNPDYYFQPLHGIADPEFINQFEADAGDPTKLDAAKETLWENIKGNLLKELQKTTCFHKKEADIGKMIETMKGKRCTALSVEECKKWSQWCEPNEIVGISLLGDSFGSGSNPFGANVLSKLKSELRSKYRRAAVTSERWFLAKNGFGSKDGWEYEESSAPSMSEEAKTREAALDEVEDAAKLEKGLPEIHLDTFDADVQEYIQKGYGQQIDDGHYQGHTLNFWLPVGSRLLTAAPLGFVSEDKKSFIVGTFDKLGSGWLFDTEKKKHSMFNGVSGKDCLADVAKNNDRSSVEYRFDVHFKTQPHIPHIPKPALSRKRGGLQRQNAIQPDELSNYLA